MEFPTVDRVACMHCICINRRSFKENKSASNSMETFESMLTRMRFECD